MYEGKPFGTEEELWLDKKRTLQAWDLMILRVSGCHSHGYYGLGLPDLANKNIWHPVKLEFQISSIFFFFTTGMSLCNIWDTLLLKCYLLIIWNWNLMASCVNVAPLTTLPFLVFHIRWWKKPTWPPTPANPGRSWCWPPPWTFVSTCWQSCPFWSYWCLSRTSGCYPSSQHWPVPPPCGAWLWSLSISCRSVPKTTTEGGQCPGLLRPLGRVTVVTGRWEWGRWPPALSSPCQSDVREHLPVKL